MYTSFLGDEYSYYSDACTEAAKPFRCQFARSQFEIFWRAPLVGEWRLICGINSDIKTSYLAIL